MVGDAFLLSWAAEIAQRDIPRSLALTSLALIAVLPEYAVAAIFAGNFTMFAEQVSAEMHDRARPRATCK